jgi:hypothetical protein
MSGGWWHGQANEDILVMFLRFATDRIASNNAQWPRNADQTADDGRATSAKRTGQVCNNDDQERVADK